MILHFERESFCIEIALFEHWRYGGADTAWTAFLVAVGDYVFEWSMQCRKVWR